MGFVGIRVRNPQSEAVDPEWPVIGQLGCQSQSPLSSPLVEPATISAVRERGRQREEGVLDYFFPLKKKKKSPKMPRLWSICVLVACSSVGCCSWDWRCLCFITRLIPTREKCIRLFLVAVLSQTKKSRQENSKRAQQNCRWVCQRLSFICASIFFVFSFWSMLFQGLFK